MLMSYRNDPSYGGCAIQGPIARGCLPSRVLARGVGARKHLGVSSSNPLPLRSLVARCQLSDSATEAAASARPHTTARNDPDVARIAQAARHRS